MHMSIQHRERYISLLMTLSPVKWNPEIVFFLQQTNTHSVFIESSISMIRTREIDIFIPIRKTFPNVHTHTGIRKTRNWFRYETFYYPFEFKVFRNEERETQFLSILTFPSNPTTQTTGLASANSENRLSCSEFKSQLTVCFCFFSNSRILSASGHDVIHVPDFICYLGFLLWHLWLSHPPPTHVNTCTQCVHLNNPCT